MATGRSYPSSEYERVALSHPAANSLSDDHDLPMQSFSAAAGNAGLTHARDIEEARADSLSFHSTAPLAPRQANVQPLYAPMPVRQQQQIRPDGLPLAHEYDNSSAHPTTVRPPLSQMTSSNTATNLTMGQQSSNWDLLHNFKKTEHDYVEFDSSAPYPEQSRLRSVQSDLPLPDNKVAKVYRYLLNASIVTRWIVFIVPVLGILWIPGILSFTAFPNGTIYDVGLLWWSVWLTVVWVGWWGALAVARVSPTIVKNTLGVVAVTTRRYVEWLGKLTRYSAFLAWSATIWISFNPLIVGRSENGKHASQVDLLGRILFALLVCAGLLFFEKFSIQWVASKFHERSYADRIHEQKLAVKILATLYSHSSEIPGRTDTLKDGHAQKSSAVDPSKLFKRALHGVRTVATTTTTALGSIASEIAGTTVLQPNSPQAMVQVALLSANKSRLLARRLYYSFRRPGKDVLTIQDIERYFPTRDAAEAAFALFDRDDNGDVSRDEIEMACMECHREQLSLQHSMQDIDSAVGRLDNILMSVYFIVVILILAVALEAQLATVITGAGTLILGLSWLIGASCQEILSSIIFLFVKHPYDVGDRVDIDKLSYTVKEIHLLSTIFLDSNNCYNQVSHAVLTGKFILNIRRSPQMSESFSYEVGYGTTFEQIEKLRSKMLAFVQAEKRDFLPSFDVSIVDIPDQEKLILSSDIKYKSNWQQGAIKTKRRNKWICALKTSLGELKIFGPKGDPGAESDPAMYTEVPWEDVKAKKEKAKAEKELAASAGAAEPIVPKTEYNFSDKHASLFGEYALYGDSDAGHQISSTGPTRPSTANAISSAVPLMPTQNITSRPGPSRGTGPNSSFSSGDIEMSPTRLHGSGAPPYT